MERVAGAKELMDGPVARLDLDRNLRDIAFANRWFGGSAPVIRCLRRLSVGTVLDVGSGGGDIAGAIIRDARRRGIAMHVTCLDRSTEMLDIARNALAANEAVQYVAGEGTRLPFADGAYDVALCTLALHHFEPPEAIVLLRELRRVSRVTPLVGDLRRSRPALAVTTLWVTLFARNRLTRHDAPLSVRRAYTPVEALDLAREAGWRDPRVRREPFFRMTLLDGDG
jgi:ubiquinone/menaquinone biosynthesis C-methylase UbiE